MKMWLGLGVGVKGWGQGLVPGAGVSGLEVENQWKNTENVSKSVNIFKPILIEKKNGRKI